LDRRNGTFVAVKVLSIEAEDIPSLQREINILAQCDDAHIVGYKGTWDFDGDLWIVMEYCAVSLHDVMKFCGHTLAENHIAAAMKMSLEGLIYLHTHRKIHRDIKSGNILVTTSGACKLADFGVSAELKTTLQKRDTMIGSPYWMAPEVLVQAKYDFKADIWSLAITAIELARGEPPLFDKHYLQAIFIIPKSDPPRLDPAKYSKDFCDFVKVCLDKKADNRPSAKELMNHAFIKNVRDEKKLMAKLLEDSMPKIEAMRILKAKEEAERQKKYEADNPAKQGERRADADDDGDGDGSTMRVNNNASGGTLKAPS